KLPGNIRKRPRFTDQHCIKIRRLEIRRPADVTPEGHLGIADGFEHGMPAPFREPISIGVAVLDPPVIEARAGLVGFLEKYPIAADEVNLPVLPVEPRRGARKIS